MADIAAPVREGMSLDEFWKKQDEQPFELIEGEIVPLSAKKYISDRFNYITRRVFAEKSNLMRMPSEILELSFTLR